MSYQIVTNFTGQVGVNPRIVRILTEDSFDDVISEGYITNGAINQILPTDVVLVKYSGGIGFFEPLFNGNIITLSASAAIPDDSVGTDQIQDLAVTTAKIADDSITNVKIEDLAVGSLKLANNAVITTKISDGAVTLAKLAAGITPSHIVFAAGSHTTTGGSATETFSVTGVLNTDIVFVLVKTLGATPVTVSRAAAGSGNISVTFSADPSTDTVVSYQVLRAAA